jgi:hypothetical protein
MERLYGSTDLLDMRRPMMAAWSEFCARLPAPEPDNVVELRTA